MKQLEDRIKERLEGYESSLPEGDFAGFKELLDKVDVKKERKSAPGWWLAPVVVAAGVALFVTFGYSPDGESASGEKDISPVADVYESVVKDEGKPKVVVIEKADTGKKNRHGYTRVSVSGGSGLDASVWTVNIDEKRNEAVSDESDSLDMDADYGTVANDNVENLLASADTLAIRKHVSVKVGKAAGGLFGGMGCVALACALPSLLGSGGDWDAGPVLGTPGGEWTSPSVDEKTGDDRHLMPIRTGVSLRVPLNERWSLTTGLDYSLYSSRLGYSLSGVRRQNVHYIGLPVRADYTLARNRWLDVYVGAGMSADFCVAAYEEGRKVAKDGIGVSLIGAGGIQLNITTHLGLFLDPAFSWNVPSGNQTLDTYKSEHPFMFSVSSGIRVTLGGRK